MLDPEVSVGQWARSGGERVKPGEGRRARAIITGRGVGEDLILGEHD